MSILKILHFPHPNLRKTAAPVAQVDDKVRQTVNDMFETMYAAPGIGLAATQVDIQQQIIVIDVSSEKNAPLCLINPEIIETAGEEEMEEGCLSVPDVYEKVTRAESVRIKAQNQQGQSFELETDGLLAVCIQHEMDHLQGKLFVDYLSPLKRQRIQKRLVKQRKQESEAESPSRRAI